MRSGSTQGTVAVSLFRDDAADRLLSDATFLAEWSALCADCPWATGFQTPQFVVSWLNAYRTRVRALLVISRDAAGRLQGLLPLARRADGGLVVAGGRQAEYQVWISRRELGDAFAASALAAVRRELPREGLAFRHLPPGSPTAWAARGVPATLIKSQGRPLMQLGDGSEVDASLRKRSNRSKVKRLEKLGGLAFRRITDPHEFDALLDELIPLYDLRHGALRGADPFALDEFKKQFHRRMMRAGDLLHVTTLRAGGYLAAAHIGVLSRGQLQLGIIAHNPMMAKHSPGRIHLLFLARQLHEEGITCLDLTTGGDPYKALLANDWDAVEMLVAFGSVADKWRATAQWTVREQTRRVLRRWDIPPAEAGLFIEDATRLAKSPASLVRKVIRSLQPRQRTELYIADSAQPTSAVAGVRRDCIADLLCYPQQPYGPSRRRFLTKAVGHLEAGRHAYTICKDGQLQCCAWLADHLDGALQDEVLGAGRYVEGGALAYDLWVADRQRLSELTEALLSTMLLHTAAQPLYAALPAGDASLYVRFSAISLRPAPAAGQRARMAPRATTASAAPVCLNSSRSGRAMLSGPGSFGPERKVVRHV